MSQLKSASARVRLYSNPMRSPHFTSTTVYWADNLLSTCTTGSILRVCRGVRGMRRRGGPRFFRKKHWARARAPRRPGCPEPFIIGARVQARPQPKVIDDHAVLSRVGNGRYDAHTLAQERAANLGETFGPVAGHHPHVH